MLRTDRTYIYIGISVLLILLDFFSILRPLKAPLENGVTPLRKFIFQSRLDILDFYQYVMHFRSLSQVLTDNARLKQDKEESQFQVRILRSENEQLRRQLGAVLPASYQFVPARVISVFDTMEIDVGEKDGITAGMTVVLETAFIGKIKTVGQNRSVVMLPTDPDMQLSAKSEKGASGIVTGQRGSGIILDKVLQKDALFLEDTVLSSGQDGTIPNLLIGKVTSITTNDTNAYKQAKLAPLIDFGKEKIVFVVTGR